MRIINPATEEMIQEITEDSEESVRGKFQMLKLGQPGWAKLPVEKRIACVARFYELLEEQKDELAATLTSEMGKPLKQSYNELAGARSRVRYFVENSARWLADEWAVEEGATRERIVYEPLGIVANISAWNYPYLVGVNVFVPALIGGNAVFYKPSEYTTLTGLHICRLLYLAGVPEDCFQMVMGKGKVGELLLQLPLDGYFFTGSYLTGKYIAEKVAPRLVTCQLELGGKDPLYVADDVEDLDKVAEAALEGVVYNNGQSCCAVERIYVHEGVYDRFVQSYTSQAKKLMVGDPVDPATEIGPLSRPAQLEFLLGQIADAVAKGAKVLYGGRRVERKGYFIEPAVLTDVNHGMKLMTEESFGPVVGIQKVKNDEEAVSLMADTEYGLTAAVYSKSYERAEGIMKQLNTGTVYWNCCDRVSASLPWSGRKRSGMGTVLGSGATDTGAAANSGILIVNTPPNSCSVTPTYTWDHSAGGEVWLSQQALKYGVKRFYANSWGAPGYMKTNNNLVSGGVICDNTTNTSTATQCQVVGDCRAAYANYLVQYVKDYQSDGVPVTDLGWINEPNTNTSSYASMTPTNTESINFLQAFGPIVQASGINVNITCCDIFNWTTANNYDLPIVASPANNYVNIYTAHEYGQVANFLLNTGTPTKKNWMSEIGPASPNAYNPYWDTVYSGTNANYNDGMFWANDISNALNLGQVSAYLYWYADSTGNTGAMIQMGNSYQATTYEVTARLYALTHFSRFVRPGAYQVGMTTSSPACSAITQGVGGCLVTTAFTNPDGTRVINVVNNYTSSQSLSLTLDAGTSNWAATSYITDVNTVPNSNATTYPPEPTSAAVALTSGVATVSGTALNATFTPRSFTTIVLTPPAVAGPVQLVLSPTLTAQGDGTFLASLTVSNLGTGTAQNVQLSGASLGPVTGSTLPTGALPYAIGDLAPGTNKVMTVNFPTGPTPGTTVLERFAGTYNSSVGAGSFGASVRAVVPTLPRN